MNSVVTVLASLLLIGCSTSGPWRAHHPEEVAQECAPPQGLEIQATTKGAAGHAKHELQTNCDEGETRMYSKRTDESDSQSVGQEVEYETKAPDSEVRINERAKMGKGTYEHTYDRNAEQKGEHGTFKSGFKFRFKFGPK